MREEWNEVEKAQSHYERESISYDLGYIYILKAANGLYKIGKTRNIAARINAIRTASPEKVEVYRVFQSTEYSRMEIHLHKMFANYREIGEWFRLTPEELETIDSIQGDHTLLPCYL
jgi:Meiotically up-regulated gene 113